MRVRSSPRAPVSACSAGLTGCLTRSSPLQHPRSLHRLGDELIDRGAQCGRCRVPRRAGAAVRCRRTRVRPGRRIRISRRPPAPSRRSTCRSRQRRTARGSRWWRRLTRRWCGARSSPPTGSRRRRCRCRAASRSQGGGPAHGRSDDDDPRCSTVAHLGHGREQVEVEAVIADAARRAIAAEVEGEDLSIVCRQLQGTKNAQSQASSSDSWARTIAVGPCPVRTACSMAPSRPAENVMSVASARPQGPDGLVVDVVVEVVVSRRAPCSAPVSPQAAGAAITTRATTARPTRRLNGRGWVKRAADTGGIP